MTVESLNIHAFGDEITPKYPENFSLPIIYTMVLKWKKNFFHVGHVTGLNFSGIGFLVQGSDILM